MTTPAKTTAYTQCEQCGFWHTPDEPHCANCGVSLYKKYEMVYDKKVVGKYSDIGMYIGALVGFLVGIGVSGGGDLIVGLGIGCYAAPPSAASSAR